VINPRRLLFALGPAHELRRHLCKVYKLNQLKPREIPPHANALGFLAECLSLRGRQGRAVPQPPLKCCQHAVDGSETHGRFFYQVVGLSDAADRKVGQVRRRRPARAEEVGKRLVLTGHQRSGNGGDGSDSITSRYLYGPSRLVFGSGSKSISRDG
jgi:hypothetical protein